jgi:hypothetical protein
MDDEPKVQQLENRIDSLESTIEKMMPSRRDALKMGGAALAGGSLMAGTASAGTNQVGTIGSASQPVDLESEDINNTDTVTTDTLDSTTVNNSGTVTTQDLVVNGQASINEFDTSFVLSELSSDQQLTSDNVRVPLEFDNVVTDRRSEFNPSTFEFTPDKDGVYFAILRIRDDNTNPQGDFNFRIFDEFVDPTADLTARIRCSIVVPHMRFLSAGNTVIAAKLDPPQDMTAQVGFSKIKIARIA